jgi:hypothetical protein
MIYITRHMRAARELQHGGILVPSGGAFYCTPIDADFYLSRKMAAAAPPPAATPEPVAAPPVDLPPVGPVAEVQPEQPEPSATAEEPPAAPMRAAWPRRRVAAKVPAAE